MYSKIMKKLASSYFDDNLIGKKSIDDVEKILNYKFPNNYRKFLNEIKMSVMFDNGAMYRPLVSSPVDAKDGTQSLEMLYGLDGRYNLVEMNQMYDSQLPDNYITIGESAGGNLICLGKVDGSIYFWYHEALYEDDMFFKIDESIDRFILNLKKDDKEVSLTGVIESESFLNF